MPRFPAPLLQGGCRKAVLGVCTSCTLSCLAFRHPYSKEDVVKQCLEFAQAAHSNTSLSGTPSPRRVSLSSAWSLHMLYTAKSRFSTPFLEENVVLGVCTSCTLQYFAFRHLPPHQGVYRKTVLGVCTSCTLSCLDFRHPYSKEDVVKQCLEFEQSLKNWKRNRWQVFFAFSFLYYLPLFVCFCSCSRVFVLVSFLLLSFSLLFLSDTLYAERLRQRGAWTNWLTEQDITPATACLARIKKEKKKEKKHW